MGSARRGDESQDLRSQETPAKERQLRYLCDDGATAMRLSINIALSVALKRGWDAAGFDVGNRQSDTSLRRGPSHRATLSTAKTRRTCSASATGISSCGRRKGTGIASFDGHVVKMKKVVYQFADAPRR